MPVTIRLHRAMSDLRSSLSAGALLAGGVLLAAAVQGAAAEATPPEASIEQRVQALVPNLKDYIATNMKAFDVLGLAIGIVAGDKLIYAEGFGVRSKGGGVPVDAQTVFQIGSTTKAFLSATMAIAVASLGRPRRRP